MNIETLTVDIANRLCGGELIAWCGAGISVPAGLPVVVDLVRAILARTGLSTSQRDRVLEAVPSRLPFERLMEVVLDTMDATARQDFLAVFGAGSPGVHHVFLARLVKRGMLKAILTTNFDPHLETALQKEGLKRGEDFEVCTDHETIGELPWPSDRPRIVKLHGSVEAPEKLGTTVSCIATPGAVRNVLAPTRWAFRGGSHTAVLAMGYSFSDRFDLSPAIAGCGGVDNAKTVFDFQFERREDGYFQVGRAARWDRNVPHPLTGFQDRWHAYGDWSKVVYRLAEILQLGDLPGSSVSSAWREILDGAFDRLERKQPGLPRVVLAGQMLTMIGDDRAALPYLREATEVAGSGLHETVHLAALQALGAALVRTGDAQGAVATLSRAQGLAESIDEGRHADYVHALLGMLYQNHGAAYTDAARSHYDQALGIARRGGSPLSQVPHLGGLATSWMRIGDFNAAERAHREALAIVEQSGDLYRTAEVYGNMGTMYYILRDYTEALAWYDKARSTAHLCGDLQGEGTHVLNLANLFAQKGEHDEALASYAEARTLLRAVLPEDDPLMQTLSRNESIALGRASGSGHGL